MPRNRSRFQSDVDTLTSIEIGDIDFALVVIPFGMPIDNDEDGDDFDKLTRSRHLWPQNKW